MRPGRSGSRRTIAALAVVALSGASQAGTLGDFESAAGAPASSSPATSVGNRGGGGVHVRSNVGANVGGDLTLLAVIGLAAGAEMSLARMRGTPSMYGVNVTPRETGAPDLPLLRLDANYQNVQGDTRATDVRIETGYGPLGLQARHTRFREDEPRDTLNLTYLHGLIRVSATPVFGLDLGLGAAWLDGRNRQDGFSATLPVAWRPHPRVEFRFAPAWSSIQDRWIRDHDISAALVVPYGSLRIGYRWVGVNGAMLKGPYAGFSVHF